MKLSYSPTRVLNTILTLCPRTLVRPKGPTPMPLLRKIEGLQSENERYYMLKTAANTTRQSWCERTYE